MYAVDDDDCRCNEKSAKHPWKIGHLIDSESREGSQGRE